MLNEIDLSRADLNLFVLFEAVLAERHVGRAAERLSLSSSAVSHGLGRLRVMLNDPLFLKHPKGVVPTERALALAEPIAEILAKTRQVVGASDKFDPATARRRFTIGAPDAVASVLLPPLSAALAKLAPGVDLNIRGQLPQTALADLDARAIDIAIQPLADLPPRFVSTPLYDEEFVIAMRAGHPLQKKMDLDAYCAASHILVSISGDPFGLVDSALQKLGRERRVAVTVPHFLLAMAMVAETDLLAAVPRRQSEGHAARFGAVLVEPPKQLRPLGHAPIVVATTQAALADAGVAWLFETVIAVAG